MEAILVDALEMDRVTSSPSDRHATDNTDRSMEATRPVAAQRSTDDVATIVTKEIGGSPEQGRAINEAIGFSLLHDVDAATRVLYREGFSEAFVKRFLGTVRSRLDQIAA